MALVSDKKEQIITAAVAAVIFNDEGALLLQKRKDVEKWCVLSGHVEFGETVQQAVLREVFEETNAKARIVRLIGIYSSPEHLTYFYENRNVQYVTSYFEVQLLEPITMVIPNEETIEMNFFKLGELPQDMAQIHPSWLSDALDKNSLAFVR